MTKRPTFAVIETAGCWDVDAHSGLRIYNADREEIASLNASAAEFRRMAERFLKVAREKDALEIFE
jgi:hypothetical protein